MSVCFYLGAILIGLSCLGIIGCGRQEDTAQTIIDMERAALDRWGNGDPGGFLEISAPEVTYYDTETELRLDGFEALEGLYKPIFGKIKIDRYEMINPKVQVHGDTAVLTFNLINYRKDEDGVEKPATWWNSTEVYSRISGEWKIIHTHWSHIRPGSRTPEEEAAFEAESLTN